MEDRQQHLTAKASDHRFSPYACSSRSLRAAPASGLAPPLQGHVSHRHPRILRRPRGREPYDALRGKWNCERGVATPPSLRAAPTSGLTRLSTKLLP